MAFSVTINGSTKTVKRGTLRITKTANGRSTCAFTVISTDGSYRPPLDATVVVADGATTLFGGLINQPSEQGVVGGKGIAAIETDISAGDFNAYADRRYIKEDFPAQTLAARLTTIVANYLAVYGVSLSGSQVTGPSLPARSYDYVQLSEVLNETATMTQASGEAFAWSIDASKVLVMAQPSTVAAPFDLVGDTLADVIGDITVEPNREHYANRVIIKVPPKTEIHRLETFTGDGSTTTFTPQYTLIKSYGYVQIGTNQYETLNTPTDPDAATWTYDPSTNTITRNSGAPASGDTISFWFDGTFNGTAVAEDAGEITTYGPYEMVVKVEDVPPDTTIQALADAYLAQSLLVPKSVKYRTFTGGLVPGQSQTITVSRRNLSGSAVITDVNIRDLGRTTLTYDVTAVIDAQTNLNKSWRDVYKTWSGDKIGAGSEVTPAPTTSSTGMSSAGPGGPNRAVQFNNSGSFGGDDAFLYYKDENSVVCGGGGSSITAADFESCQVFGYDCHIADPS